MTSPKWLYHYTSIDVLALILRNRTIRLRRLDLMDDPHEARSGDLGGAGKYIMVSCWTDSPDEELSVWSLYAGAQGVRIRLPAEPFDAPFKLSKENTPAFLSVTGQMSCIAPTDLITEGHLIVPMMPRLLKIQYTDDESRLHPNIFYSEGDSFSIALSELGKHKRLLWSFQREWRYVLEVYPMTLELHRQFEVKNVGAIPALLLEAMQKGQVPDIEFIDIPVKPSSFNKLEITLGPKISAGNRLMLESYIQKFAPDATILESTFNGHIV